MPNPRSESVTRARYNRIARVYDWLEFFIERFVFRRWRRQLWSQVPPGNGLEVGVGTGKNIPYYPPGSHVTGIDLSANMLGRARRRASKLKNNVRLIEMNAEDLQFPDNTFDWAVATFVFCSIPDAARGLEELDRVVKPGGRIFLLEHIRVDRPLIGRFMDLLNPLVVRITGANINRKTVRTVRASGLDVRTSDALGPLGVVRRITASPGPIVSTDQTCKEIGNVGLS